MTTALVLSAAGMFGAWQAGAWRALSARFQPDLVIGTSAGALNGWLIASGASPGELDAVWTDPHFADIVRVRTAPTLFNPAPLRAATRNLYERFQPRLPFALTLTRVPRLTAVMVRDSEVTAAHLAATCSIPFVYPPVRIDGRFYVDGGLLDLLPLWAAAAMGADRAIALHALTHPPSRVLRAGVRAFERLAAPRRLPEGFQATIIKPSCSLGGLHDALFWESKNARRWLDLGERDAALAVPA